MAASMSFNTMKAIVILLLACSAGCMADDDEFEGSRTLTVEHTFDSGLNPVYTKRGTIVIRSLPKASYRVTSELTSEEKSKLKALADADEIYQVRIPVKITVNGEEKMDFVSSFTKACALYESGLSDELTVSFDQSGEVLGVSLRAIPGHCTGSSVPTSSLSSWNTTINVEMSVAGPSPDTHAYIEKMKRDEMERVKGNQGDNRSFFAKYWMYIIPVVIIMMLASSQDQQGGGGR